MLFGTSGKRNLCMVPCHVCHVYGIWNLEKQRGGGMLYGVAMKATGGGGDNFNGEEGFLLCNNGALKLYFKSYWVR